jgi:hypothetical protein
METKISTRHKQDSEIYSKFKPWDGCQIVITKSLILYFGQKSKLKCNKLLLTKFAHSNLFRTSFKF